jgi:hypothetical protein
VALESQLNDLDVMVALGCALGIGEGPRATRTAKAVFYPLVQPHQWRARAVLYARARRIHPKALDVFVAQELMINWGKLAQVLRNGLIGDWPATCWTTH